VFHYCSGTSHCIFQCCGASHLLLYCDGTSQLFLFLSTSEHTITTRLRWVRLG
jgi:CDGSH-type Zn-finger protein